MLPMHQLLILPEIGPESGPQGFIDAASQGNATHLVRRPPNAAMSAGGSSSSRTLVLVLLQSQTMYPLSTKALELPHFPLRPGIPCSSACPSLDDVLCSWWCPDAPSMPSPQTMVPSVAASLIQRLQRRGASRGSLAAAALPDHAPLLPKLRLLMLSGEPLSSGCLSTIRRHLVGQECRVLNVYGSTEAAADCTFFDASSSGSVRGPPPGTATAPSSSDDASDPTAMIPIGHPLEGFAVMVCQVCQGKASSHSGA